MKTVRVFLFFSSLLFVASRVCALDDPKVARVKYDEFAAKVNSGDLNVDWQALRLAARVGEVYGNYDPYEAAQRTQAAFEKGNYEDALKIARETEQHNISDGDAHLAAWNCLMKLGREREADQERNILQALLQSILKSGDGKSAKKAWFAVSIREEFLVMQLILQVQFKQQHSLRQDGHYYDVVSVTNQSGKDSVLWFNTDTDIELGMRAGHEGHHIY